MRMSSIGYLNSMNKILLYFLPFLAHLMQIKLAISQLLQLYSNDYSVSQQSIECHAVQMH